MVDFRNYMISVYTLCNASPWPKAVCNLCREKLGRLSEVSAAGVGQSCMKLSVSVRGAVRMPMHRAKVATDKLAVLFVEYDNVVTLADMQPWLHVSKSDSCY